MSEVLDAQLLSPEEVAKLTSLEPGQVYHWIAEDKVPYIEAPARSGQFKLPFQGFLNCLPNLVDLAGDLEIIEQTIKR